MVEHLPYHHLADELMVRPGITAVIGSGGKSTLIETLAKMLRYKGARPDAPHGENAGDLQTARAPRVIITTTTHIRRTSPNPVYTGDDPDALDALLERAGIVCCGTPAAEDKLAAPEIPLDTLAAHADYVLVEADGSRGIPAKAHAAHEPVIPAQTNLVVDVVGAQAFGRPIREAVHRPELFCARTGLADTEVLTPEAVAQVIISEREGDALHLPSHARFQVALSHAGDETSLACAMRLAHALGAPVLAWDHPTRRLARLD